MAENKKRSSGGKKPSVVNFAKHFQGIDFPCNKQDLIQHAKQMGAGKSLLEMLDQIEDREYDGMTDVMKEYGKRYEQAA